MRTVLFEKLLARPGFSKLDAGNLEEAKQQSGHLILFCTGDPQQRPESQDLAVILPELYQAFDAQFRVGLVTGDIEETVQQCYGVQQWPCLVLLRDGEYVGSISRLRDWAEYLQEIAALLKAPLQKRKDLTAFIITQPQGCT
jgi:hydrogenase-1 operon protein HyaE